jgi:predicted O-linked N-acetylglucosamine transferase (SPINDLY family)
MDRTASDESPAVLLQRASIWHKDGKLEQAEEGYRRVLALDPTDADALNLLGLLHHEHGDSARALSFLEAAIKLAPPSGARFHLNLGVAKAGVGDHDGALAAYRMATLRSPGTMKGWHGVIWELDQHPHATPAMRLDARRAVEARHGAALTAAAPPHENDRDPDRTLRIGYLGGDFRNHSAASVFAPILSCHDKERFEVSIYWQNEQPADEVTALFKGLGHAWFEVSKWTDESLAENIRAREIDILVDLAGYSEGSRILALARKPAPILITAWGHLTGLGLSCSDWILADEITIPERQEEQYTERVLRLPCAMAFMPWAPYPEVAEPPQLRKGYPTFGYLGRTSKLNPVVLGTWAQLLHRIPNARLLLKHGDYRQPRIRQRVVDTFVGLGIEEHRLELRTATVRYEHLAAHHDIDIALEPWPMSGGVTTLEATLMGVPSVAMLGDAIQGRIASSILKTIGASDWTAFDQASYVERAVTLAAKPWTVYSRTSLRESLLGSVICDGPRYTAAVENLYRHAWRDWVAARQGVADGIATHRG